MLNTNFWIGLVEDVQDPEYRGRVRVRIFGVHDVYSAMGTGHSGNFQPNTDSPNAQEGTGLPTSDLPWALCTYPVTFGGTESSTVPPPSVLPGAWVFGTSLDGNFYQELIVLGVLPSKRTFADFATNVFKGNTNPFTPQNRAESNYPAENPENNAPGTITFNQLTQGIIQAESGGVSGLISSADCCGLMQVMPAIAAKLVVGSIGVEATTADKVHPMALYNGTKSFIRSKYLEPRSTGAHGGIDLDFPGVVPSGVAPVVAYAAGTVVRASYSTTYGNVVYINHADGTQSRYAHLSNILVSNGASVQPGTEVGKMGTTGRSTGVHLHFELRSNNGAGPHFDPTFVVNLPAPGAAGSSGAGGAYASMLESAGEEFKVTGILREILEYWGNDQYSLNGKRYVGHWGKTGYARVLAKFNNDPMVDKFKDVLRNNDPFNILCGQNALRYSVNKSTADPVLAALYYNQGDQNVNNIFAKNGWSSNAEVPSDLTYDQFISAVGGNTVGNNNYAAYIQKIFNAIQPDGGLAKLTENQNRLKVVG